MDMIPTWNELSCEKCEGKNFRQLVHLTWKEGQGTAIKPGGYECATCNAPADMGELVKGARRKTLEKQKAELDAQL